MEEQFIPYDQALELGELGFNELCLTKWGVGSKNFYKNYVPCSNTDDIVLSGDLISAPLWQQAFHWFRTKHGLVGNVEYLLNRWFCYIINDGKDEKTSRCLFTEFKTYEEAQLELLKRLIKTVKENETRN